MTTLREELDGIDEDMKRDDLEARLRHVAEKRGPNKIEVAASIELEAANRIADLKAKLERAREALEGQVGVSNSLVNLIERDGVLDDALGGMFPDMKKSNGQPVSDYVKEARRTVNEARRGISIARQALKDTTP